MGNYAKQARWLRWNMVCATVALLGLSHQAHSEPMGVIKALVPALLSCVERADGADPVTGELECGGPAARSLHSQLSTISTPPSFADYSVSRQTDLPKVPKSACRGFKCSKDPAIKIRYVDNTQALKLWHGGSPFRDHRLAFRRGFRSVECTLYETRASNDDVSSRVRTKSKTVCTVSLDVDTLNSYLEGEARIKNIAARTEPSGEKANGTKSDVN